MKISGQISKILYRNSENGYTVVELGFGAQKIVATGKFPVVGIGENLELVGEFKVNKNYGEQFVTESVKVSKPTDISSIKKYLSCGLISGVGEVTANNIVNTFKEHTLDVIENNPKMLSSVKGISERKAFEIHKSYQNIKNMQEAVMFLQKYDITIGSAIKIYEKYKDKTEEVLTDNPYILVEDIDGIGFKTADKIAMKLGVAFDSSIRIRAGIVYILNEIAKNQGSTVAMPEQIFAETLELLQLDETFLENIEDALLELEIEGSIKKVKFEDIETYAISKYYSMENYIAKKLLNLCDDDNIVPLANKNEIDQFEILNQIKLHESQRYAVESGTSKGVVVITGGPGTGKTTIIKGIINIFKNKGLKYMLMAPTGRAAKRLEEQTGEEASTIHRALQANFQKNGRGFTKNEHNPLEADAIVVDEVSMLDVQLFYFLLKAVSFGTRLILVGDKDQLPSVGAGNVLADIISSEKFEVVRLTQIFRQSEDSMIVVNSHKINNSEMPDLKAKSSDFFYSSTSEPNAMAEEILSLISERLPRYFNISSDEIQIISPMKAGIVGVNNLNVLVQQKLNPESPAKRTIELQKRVFREGDKVMQIVNNYSREWEKINKFGYAEYGNGVFNGDMGHIELIQKEINELVVLFEDGRRAIYSYAELDEIVLSYAITIHKSQGSEFKIVIIPVTGGSPVLMNKNLLYTAVTRAKQAVVLIGKSSNIFYMVNNKSSAVRNTMLGKLLKKFSSVQNANEDLPDFLVENDGLEDEYFDETDE